MKRMLKIVISLCCVIFVAAALVSCGAGDLPDDETLRKDFENYLNYYGDLPFTYNFKSFEIQDRVKNRDEKTGIVTIEASVERLYNGEVYNDITYVADLHYADVEAKWEHEYVVVKSSDIVKGFDLESVFYNTVWTYDEESSATEADKLEVKGVPLSLNFDSMWDKDTLNVTVKFSEEDVTGMNSTFRGMEAYVEQYGGIEKWDFRIVYIMDNGGVIDFVHVSGALYEAENWVVGYRESTTKERSLAFYMLEPVEE